MRVVSATRGRVARPVGDAEGLPVVVPTGVDLVGVLVAFAVGGLGILLGILLLWGAADPSCATGAAGCDRSGEEAGVTTPSRPGPHVDP